MYRRVTLVGECGRIVKAFHPVFPPERNAEEVVAFLTDLASVQAQPERSDHAVAG